MKEISNRHLFDEFKATEKALGFAAKQSLPDRLLMRKCRMIFVKSLENALESRRRGPSIESEQGESINKKTMVHYYKYFESHKLKVFLSIMTRCYTLWGTNCILSPGNFQGFNLQTDVLSWSILIRLVCVCGGSSPTAYLFYLVW